MAAFLLYLLGAVVFTYPLALDPSRSVTDVADPLLDSWALAWVAHELPRDPVRLFDANRFYPEKGTLALTDPMIATAVLVAPVQYVFGSPILALNTALLLSIALSGLGAFLLVRHLTGSPAAAGVSGSIFAFNPYRLSQLSHVNLQAAGFIPLLLLFLARYLERGRRGDAVAAAACLWLVSASCAYYGLFTWTVLLAFIPYEAWRTGAWRKSRRIVGVAAATAVSAAAFLPLALPLIHLQSDLGVARPLSRIERASARPGDYLRSGSRLHREAGLPPPSSERTLFPGFAALGLALAALARRPRRIAGAYLLLGSLALWASLGPRYGLYGWLYAWFPGVSGLRVPPRYVIFVLLAVAVLAGLGADYLLRELRGSRGAAAAVATAGLLSVFPLVESGGAPIGYVGAPPIPDVYRWVAARERPSPIIELPFDWAPPKNALYLYWSTAHFQPIANGYSTFVPASYDRLMRTMSSFPDERSVGLLRRLGIRFVVLHRDLFLRERASRLEAAMNADSGLAPVHETPEAVVYAVLRR